MTLNHDERYKQARKRVNELKGFYTHLGIYLLVIFFLFTIDAMDGENWWFYWPMLGWGVFGVGIHAMKTFSFGRDWEERKIQELMGEKPKRQIPDTPPDDYFENP